MHRVTISIAVIGDALHCIENSLYLPAPTIVGIDSISAVIVKFTED